MNEEKIKSNYAIFEEEVYCHQYYHYHQYCHRDFYNNGIRDACSTAVTDGHRMPLTGLNAQKLWIGLGLVFGNLWTLLCYWASLCDANNIHRPHDLPSLKESQAQHPKDDPTKTLASYVIYHQVKRLDDKNQQFSADVLEKHNYIKELISDTKTGLQVLQVDD